MTNPIPKYLATLLVTGLLLVVPSSPQAETHTSSDKIVYQLEFRTDDKFAANKHIREGRVVLDEMVANKGADKLLDEFNWTTLAERSAFAEHWIKEQDQAQFDDVIRQLRSTKDKLDNRAGHIQDLRHQIASAHKTQKARWDKLLDGDSIQDHLLKALGIEVAGTVGSRMFGWISKHVSSKLASGLAAGAGKAIGPISTAASLYQFFAAYGDYAEMKLMLGDLLEQAEMIAYLDVLLKKYDGILAAQDKIIDELVEAYAARAKSNCR